MISRSDPLPDVSVEQVESYLQAKNWMSDGAIRQVATIWHRVDSREAEVVLPVSHRVKDFRQRLEDALRSLATHEQRSVADVADDIVGILENVITVRVVGGDTATGTIPIEDGVLLIKKVKELLYAASMSVYAKRRQFFGAPPKDAKAYMDSLLLGQTEVGSYVVNVIAPAGPCAVTSAEGVSESSLADVVAHGLVGGLTALRKAGDRYEVSRDVTVFEHAVNRGVSANMCDALLGFSGKHHNRSFEIKISSSSTSMFGRATMVFPFDADDVETLQMASSYYKNDYVLLDREIIGSVKHLHRAKGDEVGTITVEAAVGDTERSVQIQLGPEEYHLGVLAHDNKGLVQCTGDIHVKSRTTRLLNPRGFKIVEFQPLF